MKKILFSVLLALTLLATLVIPVTATETGLGISPVSLDITLGEGESGVWDFNTYYFTGTIGVEAINIPILVSPNSFDVLSSPSVLSLTLTNIASVAGVYTGYLRFTGLNSGTTGLAIQVDINVSVTATVEAPPPSGGGGGLPPADSPPIISGLRICEDVAETTAVICWTTSETSTSQVEYWSSPSLFSPLDEAYVIEHRVELTGLTPATTYYYKAMSRDKGGNLTVSEVDTFTTLGEEVVPAPPEPAPVEPEPVKPEPVKPEPIKPEPIKPEPIEPVVAEEPSQWHIGYSIAIGFGAVAIVFLIWMLIHRMRKKTADEEA